MTDPSQLRTDKWAIFSDVEIEVLADRVADSEPLYHRGVTANETSDPDYVNAHWSLLDDLRAERIARGFEDTCRSGSPHLEDEG